MLVSEPLKPGGPEVLDALNLQTVDHLRGFRSWGVRCDDYDRDGLIRKPYALGLFVHEPSIVILRRSQE
jgi:hypothetical protein